jgi:hypothetical protein
VAGSPPQRISGRWEDLKEPDSIVMDRAGREYIWLGQRFGLGCAEAARAAVQEAHAQIGVLRPKRTLTGDGNERVDTRVLQIIYAIRNTSFAARVEQQVDVFVEAAPQVVSGRLAETRAWWRTLDEPVLDALMNGSRDCSICAKSRTAAHR